MSIPEAQILKVMELLTSWNPLGERAVSIKDLNNYRTEAIDILFLLSLRGPKANVALAVRDVLNQAFDLSLSVEECMAVGREISTFVEAN